MAKIKFYEDPEFLRRQTWVILLGMVCLVVSLFVPLYSLEVANFSADVTGMQLAVPGKETLAWSFYAIVVSILFAIFTLSQYRARPKQASSMLYLAILTILASTIAYLFANNQVETFALQGVVSVKPQYGLIFPTIAFLLFFYARNLILSDIKKLKQAGRFW